MTKFDICVIGAGSGGLSVAAAASSFGEKVVLIEKGEMGGDCLNYGCVPSKALIAASKHAHAFKTGAPFGIAPAEPVVDYQQVHDHVHRVIGAIAPHDSQERFEGLGVKVVRAPAKFVDESTVEAGGERFKARRFVIATGSSPAAPPIPGLDDVDYFTNETIFENTVRPEHLIVIGAGPIGLEMAQAHRRLGAKVTVLEAFKPLAKDDSDLTGIVLKHIADEGIELLSEIKVVSLSQSDNGITAEIEKNGERRHLTGSHLLVAAGRKPNVEGLNLEAAGVKYDKRGVEVDQGLRTSNNKIYAIGDVTGGLQFTHVAGYQAGLVIRSILFRMGVKNQTRHIPWVTYTDPELAHVGYTEADARKEFGDEVVVLQWPFKDNDRAQAEGKTDGLIKVVVGKKGKIIGASIVGPNAGELIQSWGMAITAGMKIKAMIDQVVAYPTMAEVGRRAAITYYGDVPKKPLIRFVIRMMKLFG